MGAGGWWESDDLGATRGPSIGAGGAYPSPLIGAAAVAPPAKGQDRHLLVVGPEVDKLDTTEVNVGAEVPLGKAGKWRRKRRREVLKDRHAVRRRADGGLSTRAQSRRAVSTVARGTPAALVLPFRLRAWLPSHHPGAWGLPTVILLNHGVVVNV